MARSRLSGLPRSPSVGAVAVCPGLPFQLAREAADLVVIHEPNPMALVAYFLARPRGQLDRLVSQRSRPAQLAVRALLSAVSPLRVRAGLADRGVVAQLAETSAAAAGMAGRSASSFRTAVENGPATRTNRGRRAPTPFGARSASPFASSSAGSLNYKGVDVLLAADATRRLHRSSWSGEGPMRARSNSQAGRRRGRSREVCRARSPTTSWRRSIARAISSCCHRSRRQEAFGVVQIEAMAARQAGHQHASCGTGIGWVNQDGETGSWCRQAMLGASRRDRPPAGRTRTRRQTMGPAARPARSRGVRRRIAWSNAMLASVPHGDREAR